MNVTLHVEDHTEADAVRRAWANQDVRDFVVMIGLLDTLTPDTRAQVLRYAALVRNNPNSHV